MSDADGVDDLRQRIEEALVEAGRASLYLADANESDPRYRSHAVRMPTVKAIWRQVRSDVRALNDDEKLELASRLVESGYGEQQTIANLVLELMVDRFEPEHLATIDEIVHQLHGWSKVDTFATGIVKRLLDRFPDEIVELARAWNTDPDPWPRRMSVVIFTRSVAASGRFDEVASELCDNLAGDPHLHVRKGVAWARRDLTRTQ
jgi:3-methyladenine DNA glycosylase AlkD